MSDSETPNLTHKQERFIAEYLVDLNATQAAIRAGYSVDSAAIIGFENLTKPYIAVAIAEARSKIATKLEVTAERVVAEYAKLAFANMADYVNVHEGDPFTDLTGCDRDKFAAISELTSETYTDGRGEDARDVKKVKLKLHDKKAALDSLGRHLGMFVDKIETKDTTWTDEQCMTGLTTVLERIAADVKAAKLAEKAE